MPNRIIKESILTSPSINKLSIEAERHFYRLLLLTDDYGCFEADIRIIKGRCYPLQEKVNIEDIKLWHKELEEHNIIKFWDDKNERIYGLFINFDKHNSKYSVTEDGKVTRHRRKTPEPPKKFLPIFATFCQPLHNHNPNHNPNQKLLTQAKSPELRSALTNVYKQGLNIYSLINKLKKQLGWDKGRLFPEEVLLKVCSSYQQNKQDIKDQWAWFVAVIKKAS